LSKDSRRKTAIHIKKEVLLKRGKAMGTLLVRNAKVFVTMDDQRREISGCGLFAQDGYITQVGTNDQLPETTDEVVDLSGHVVLPGLVNTQTRSTPALDSFVKNSLADFFVNPMVKTLRILINNNLILRPDKQI
jgi:hypothetical protein